MASESEVATIVFRINGVEWVLVTTWGSELPFPGKLPLTLSDSSTGNFVRRIRWKVDGWMMYLWVGSTSRNRRGCSLVATPRHRSPYFTGRLLAVPLAYITFTRKIMHDWPIDSCILQENLLHCGQDLYVSHHFTPDVKPSHSDSHSILSFASWGSSMSVPSASCLSSASMIYVTSSVPSYG